MPAEALPGLLPPGRPCRPVLPARRRDGAYREVEARVFSALQAAASRPQWSPWGHWSTLLAGSLCLRVNEQHRSATVEPIGAWWPAAATFDLGAPLSDWDWLDAMVQEGRWRDLVEEAAEDNGQPCGWVLLRLRNAVRSDTRTVVHSRAQIRAALTLPHDLVVLAQRTRLDLSRRGFDASHLTRVWRWRSALERVHRESPSLLRIAMAAIEAQVVDEPTPDLVARVKHYLRSHAGWSQRFWALVAQTDGFFDEPLSMRHGSSPALKIIANYGRTLDAASVRSPPHPLVARALLRSQADPLVAEAPFDPGWFKGHCSVLRLALRAAASARGDLDRFLREEFHPFLRWSCATAADTIDPRACRGGWPWVMRQQSRHHARLRRSTIDARWASALGTFQCAGLDVVPLSSSAELLEEGDVMRNCLAVRQDIVQHCMAGGLRLFSLRREGKRVATASLARCSFIELFYLEEVRGKANSDVSDAVVQVAQRLCDRYNEALSGTPMSNCGELGEEKLTDQAHCHSQSLHRPGF